MTTKLIIILSVKDEPRQNPCIPSPCGPNSQCTAIDDRASCSCIPGMFGAPPNCRPECTINQDCPSNRACFKQRCKDPCVGSCGFNAECTVQSHQPICKCFDGYEGDPYSGCNFRDGEPKTLFVTNSFIFTVKTFLYLISRIHPYRNTRRNISPLQPLSLWCKCYL